MEGIYLIHPREFVSTDLSIYKLGRSNNIDNRVKQYPKGSNILCMLMCKNSIACEKYLIKLFKNKFTQNTYYGSEYFEGDKQMMIREIFNHLDEQYVKNKKIEAEIEAKKKANKVVKTEVKIEDKKVIKNEAKTEAKTEAKKESKKESKKEAKKEANKKDIKINDIVITTKCKNTHNNFCPKCKENFKYPSILKRHLLTSVRCISTPEYIKNLFIENSNLETNNIDQNLFRCDNCNNSYKYKTSLYKHKRISKCSV
jgi:hypothetical protein